jgi:hypothetical protein
MFSDKSKHSAAMGMSWCTPTGFSAIAADLVLSRTSEANIGRFIAPQFKAVPHKMALSYDKGVPTLRIFLPNMNNVLVPCFLKAGKYSSREVTRNRAIASNRYVVEITYARVKQWGLLSGVAEYGHFHLLNHVWWWALGFSNLQYGFLKPPRPSIDEAGKESDPLI